MKKYIFTGHHNDKSLYDLFSIDQYSGGTVEHLEKYVEQLISLNVSLLNLLLDKEILSGDDINEISSQTIGYDLGRIQGWDVSKEEIEESVEINDPDKVLQGNDAFEWINGKWRLKT